MDRPSYLKGGEVARLFPALSEKQVEMRTLSAFLGCLTAVPEYRNLLLNTIGIKLSNRDKFSAFTEVVFKDDKLKKNDRPDGLIVVSKGGQEKAKILLEAKIGKKELDKNQLKKYIDLARENDVDAIITISNQFTATPRHHPCGPMRSGRVGLYHWSWPFLKTQAHLLTQEQSFDDEDRIYLLREWVRFLDHPHSGLSSFIKMNSDWADVVDKVIAGGVLRKDSDAVVGAVSSWNQEIQDLALQMSNRLDVGVSVYLKRAYVKDIRKRLDEDLNRLCKSNVLEDYLIIPDAADALFISCDLKARSVIVSMNLSAINKKTAKARIKWIVSQLDHLKDTKGLRIRAYWGPGAKPTQDTVDNLRNNPEDLIKDDSNSVPTGFDVFFMKTLGDKFSRPKKFVEEVEKAVREFYQNVGEHLRRHTPPAPRTKADPEKIDNGGSEEAAKEEEGNQESDTSLSLVSTMGQQIQED